MLIASILLGLAVALGGTLQYKKLRAARRREARNLHLAMAALYKHRGWLNRTRAKVA